MTVVAVQQRPPAGRRICAQQPLQAPATSASTAIPGLAAIPACQCLCTRRVVAHSRNAPSPRPAAWLTSSLYPPMNAGGAGVLRAGGSHLHAAGADLAVGRVTDSGLDTRSLPLTSASSALCRAVQTRRCVLSPTSVSAVPRRPTFRSWSMQARAARGLCARTDLSIRCSLHRRKPPC